MARPIRPVSCWKRFRTINRLLNLTMVSRRKHGLEIIAVAIGNLHTWLVRSRTGTSVIRPFNSASTPHSWLAFHFHFHSEVAHIFMGNEEILHRNNRCSRKQFCKNWKTVFTIQIFKIISLEVTSGCVSQNSYTICGPPCWHLPNRRPQLSAE